MNKGSKRMFRGVRLDREGDLLARQMGKPEPGGTEKEICRQGRWESRSSAEQRRKLAGRADGKAGARRNREGNLPAGQMGKPEPGGREKENCRQDRWGSLNIMEDSRT